MTDALGKYRTVKRSTPQTMRADEREVQNNAGGYVFEISNVNRLRRFLILGTEGGTFYVKEAALTEDNANVVIAMAKASDPRLLDEIHAISTTGRAPRNNPAIFALAAATRYGNNDFRARAYRMFPEIVRIGTDLTTFANYRE